MPEPYTVAVVGAGFSGVMTAVHLLRARPARPVRVVTVNRSGPSARGVAYGTNSPNHLLNVPAGRMSAFPDAPADFADFARGRDPAVTPGAFVRRSVYGEYLEATLAVAITGAGPNRIERVVGEVRSIRVEIGRATLLLADGSLRTADHVVLAVGNYPPTDPPGLPAAVTASPLYIRDPWARGALAAVPAGRYCWSAPG